MGIEKAVGIGGDRKANIIAEGITVAQVLLRQTVSGSAADAGVKVRVGATHEADLAARGRLRDGTAVSVAGTSVAVAGIGIARIDATRVLGPALIAAAFTFALLLLLAPLEALFLAAIAYVQAVATGLAAAADLAGTSAWTSALALAGRVVPFALANRDDGRKWFGLGRIVVTFAVRIVVTFAGRVVAFALALALAPASALSFATSAPALAPALAFARVTSKEDVVAAL